MPDRSPFSPVLSAPPSGDAFVTWTDTRDGNEDIYISRIMMSDGSEAPSWTEDGVAVCTATLSQSLSKVTALAPGEPLVAWEDGRLGADWNIFAQSLTTTGTLSSGWTENGIAVCAAINPQARTAVLRDGAGGAFITWADHRSGSADIYATLITSAGAPAPAWPVDGIAACSFSGNQQNPLIATDGSGGAMILWEDNRATGFSLYASRMTSAGALAASWTTNGTAIATAPNSHTKARIVPSVSGRTVFAWVDSRPAAGGASDDIYAAAVYPSGALVPVALSSFSAE